MLLTFFSDPVLILNINEVFRTKRPRETSTKNRLSAKVRENPKFSLPQAKEIPGVAALVLRRHYIIDLFGGAPHKGF